MDTNVAHLDDLRATINAATALLREALDDTEVNTELLAATKILLACTWLEVAVERMISPMMGEAVRRSPQAPDLDVLMFGEMTIHPVTH